MWVARDFSGNSVGEVFVLHVQRAIGQSLQRSRFADASFTPMHCHRLDAATGGSILSSGSDICRSTVHLVLVQ